MDAEARPKTQFRLLGSRRLLPLFVAQFLGAFNDNVFKQALIVLFTFGTLLAAGANQDVYVNVAVGLLVLPFVLFSATAGNLADHFEKSRLIRLVKLGEVGTVALAGISLYLASVPLLLLALFLFGVQSAFFGPLKYAILPQHLGAAELVGGNGMIQMGTLVAILIGTNIGGFLAGDGEVSFALFGAMVAIAAAGYLASRHVPPAPPAETNAAIRWNPWTESLALIRIARERRPVFLSILGISWFWLLGTVNLAQIPSLTKDHLAAGPGVVTLIITFFTIAIAIGALLCERLSGRRVELGLVPVGAAGVSLFGIDLYFAINALDGAGQRTVWEFLAGDGTTRLLADLGMMGVFAGLFVVPLQANIQSRTPMDRRARVIAANNVINAVFMVAGAGFAIGWLSLVGDVPGLLLTLAVVNLGVSAYIFQQVPEFTMRFLVWALSHSVYRVRHRGLEAIPEQGAAVIVCNHVSYVDAPLLAGAVRRPIRFVMDRGIYELPVLNFIFRTGRAIPIAPEADDAEVYEAAFREIRAALEAGDLVCIFPEGRLTGDGEVGRFRKGVERIVAETPAPVVPMALTGLWGSFYSREGGGAFRSARKRLWRRVEVIAGEPVRPDRVSADALRSRVLALRG